MENKTLKTKLQRLDKSKSRGSYHCISVVYENNGREVELTRVFLNNNQVDLLHILGYEFEDHREKEE